MPYELDRRSPSHNSYLPLAVCSALVGKHKSLRQPVPESEGRTDKYVRLSDECRMDASQVYRRIGTGIILFLMRCCQYYCLKCCEKSPL